MKLLIILIAIAGLLLLPMTGFSEPTYTVASLMPTEQNAMAVKPPPVAQSLVREGSFAVKLAEAFNIGTPQDEAAAESMLASIGIAPNNGWIADYPVTPEVIDQLQNAIRAAINSGKLAMNTATAVATLQTVADDFGLNIVVTGARGNQTAGPPAKHSNEYTNPAVVNNYYYDYGPPVITYYSPPPAYLYLYAWVPSPFRYADFYFPGFFILNDFDTVIVVHHRREICTNHVYNRGTGTFFIINPVNGRYYRSVREFPHFNRLEARKGGEAISHRSWPKSRNRAHETMPREFRGRNLWSSGSGERFRQPAPHSLGSPDGRMNRSLEERHFHNFQSYLGNRGQREVIRPPLRSNRSYRPPFSEQSHDRMESYGNRDSSGGFHGGHSEGIPGGGSGREGFEGGFHGRHFEGFHRGSEGHERIGHNFHRGGGFRSG